MSKISFLFYLFIYLFIYVLSFIYLLDYNHNVDKRKTKRNKKRKIITAQHNTYLQYNIIVKTNDIIEFT